MSAIFFAVSYNKASCQRLLFILLECLQAYKVFVLMKLINYLPSYGKNYNLHSCFTCLHFVCIEDSSIRSRSDEKEKKNFFVSSCVDFQTWILLDMLKILYYAHGLLFFLPDLLVLKRIMWKNVSFLSSLCATLLDYSMIWSMCLCDLHHTVSWRHGQDIEFQQGVALRVILCWN